MARRSPFRSPLYWAAFLAGLGWAVVLWVRAPPLASVLDDEIGHFLIARDAWVHPALILNTWGRTGTTVPFMLPAAAGLGVARAVALVMSAVTVVVATQIARAVGVRALALVPIFLWFQPWFHLYGSAVLTEVPFSLLMAAGCWAALAGRDEVASLLFGLLPLVRHEGIAIVGLWGLFLVLRRRWRPLALAAVPVLVYQAAFSIVFREAPFALYFHTAANRPYGHGGWLHYALPLARSVGPPVVLLAAAGLALGRRNRRLLTLSVPYVLLVVVETVIFRFGLFASGGNADYLLPLAVFAAVAAALGADRLVDAASARRFRIAVGRPVVASAAVASLLAVAAIGYALRTEPAHADRGAEPMRSAVRFLAARHTDMSRVTATHVWFFELSGARIPGGDGLHSPWSNPSRPHLLPHGSIVVWDCFYSNRFGLRWSRLARSGFRELARFGGGRVVVLQRGRRPRSLPAQPRCTRADRGAAPLIGFSSRSRHPGPAMAQLSLERRKS